MQVLNGAERFAMVFGSTLSFSDRFLDQGHVGEGADLASLLGPTSGRTAEKSMHHLGVYPGQSSSATVVRRKASPL